MSRGRRQKGEDLCGGMYCICYDFILVIGN